jgi:hypothetical protein
LIALHQGHLPLEIFGAFINDTDQTARHLDDEIIVRTGLNGLRLRKDLLKALQSQRLLLGLGESDLRLTTGFRVDERGRRKVEPSDCANRERDREQADATIHMRAKTLRNRCAVGQPRILREAMAHLVEIFAKQLSVITNSDWVLQMAGTVGRS